MKLKLDCGLTTKDERRVSKRYCVIQNTWYGKSIEICRFNMILTIDLIYR